MKARSCWSFRSPKRSSTFLTRPRRNTDCTCRHFTTAVISGRERSERTWNVEIPGSRSAPPGMTRFGSTTLTAQRYKRAIKTEFFMQDLWRLPAKDIAALIRSKKVSAKEAATAAVGPLDGVHPKIH